MIFDQPKGRVWLCTKPTDMRKSYTGLQALVRNELKQKPIDGDFFIFIIRRKYQLKILYFERNGYCIWSKRLEQGQFKSTANTSSSQELTWIELKLLLEGI